MEKHPIFQGLMDGAYHRWQNKEFASHEEMCEKISPEAKMAVYIGNFNYQVCNGGFLQWVCNGYGLNLDETVKALKEIGTKNAKISIQLLERIRPHLNFDANNHGCFGDYWKTSKCDCDFGYRSSYDGEEEEACSECDGNGTIEDKPDFLDELDDLYYEFNEALMDEVESYFSKKAS